jgi:ketosteroid isomerase-like protein
MVRYARQGLDWVFRERGMAMMTANELETSDKLTLVRLNQEYVDAFMNADVDWYREHLAEDFVCIESDGSVLDKSEFLTNTAKGPDVADYRLQDVDVRIYGSTALVQATGLWTGKNGTKGMSRYIDVYAKSGEEWKTVSAQITRTLMTEPRGRYKL